MTTFYQVTWVDGEHWKITRFTDPREAYRFARRLARCGDMPDIREVVVKPSQLVDRTASA